jgi:Fic family protein
MDPDQEDRHSQALEPDIPHDPDELARREARNGLRQFDAVMDGVDYFIHPERPFKLRLSRILALHRIALEGITRYAGNFRPSEIAIGKSRHKPPPAHLVPELVEEMCDYVNNHWEKPAVHLAAYIMWRLNWIHPFTDGNGRTARAMSYMALCIRLGYRLPGTRTIPEFIATNKQPYYTALEDADRAWENDTLDLSSLEKLLAELLAAQLMTVHDAATGVPQHKSPTKLH